jgi:energy-converting hydrogenase Eha subunit G
MHLDISTPPILPGSTASPADAALPALVSEVYRTAPASLRVKLLECLLRPVGPLALAVIASGAFGAFLQRRTWAGASLSIDDVSGISAEQFSELAGYLEQASPEVFLQMPALLAGSPLVMATGSGAVLLASLLQRPAGRARAAATVP